MALAERFKQAIEAKAHERGLIVPAADGTQDATMNPDGLVYNVYVVTGEGSPSPLHVRNNSDIKIPCRVLVRKTQRSRPIRSL